MTWADILQSVFLVIVYGFMAVGLVFVAFRILGFFLGDTVRAFIKGYRGEVEENPAAPPSGKTRTEHPDREYQDGDWTNVAEREAAAYDERRRMSPAYDFDPRNIWFDSGDKGDNNGD